MLHFPTTKSRGKHHTSGQAVVFVLMALVVLAVVFLWNVDVHILMTTKTKAQNAGDAAAIAAARWQGNTLNLLGELNIMHAIALNSDDQISIDAITNMQARLCFTGPLTGLAAAQVAAKKNGAKSRDEFTEKLLEHANEVEAYSTEIGGNILFPEPYPGAWEEYANAIREIARDGIAVAPDNAAFFTDSTHGHILLDKGFYEAVAGRSWCWFYLNYSTGSGESTRTILDDFTDYTYFGPIPEPDPPLYRNSEIFGVAANVRTYKLRQTAGLEEMLKSAVGETVVLSTNVFNTTDNWYVYDSSAWENYWPGMTYGGEDFLPLAGSVREEYNYTGADAVTRLYIGSRIFSSPDSSSDDDEDDDELSGEEREIVWTAAAKPFGYLELSGEDGTKVRPNAFGLIMPAFRDIRLIPMDSASSGGDSAFDIQWREHTDEHLPPYTESGALVEGCRYCKLIDRFEEKEFREKGSEWLVKNHHLCTLPSGSGGHHGGGTRRGH